jgi:hypothetical protein
LILNHIQALLLRPEFDSCPIILGVESNLGPIADLYEEWIQQAQLESRVCVIHESPNQPRSEAAVGVRTTNSSKFLMADLTQSELEQRHYRIATEVTSITAKNGAQEHLKELREQLYVYSRLVELPMKTGGQIRIIYTGKHARTCDDLSIAFQLNRIVSMKFHSPVGRQAYAQYHAMCPVAA